MGRRMLSSEVSDCSEVKWRPKSFRPFDWAVLNERPGGWWFWRFRGGG
ncbi:MAG: hypothetical protein ACTS44_00850 [Candidatus Hodgkinia cicadicola]